MQAARLPLWTYDCCAGTGRGDGAVGIVRRSMTHEHACIRRAIVRDGSAAPRGHDIYVEVNQPLAGDGSTGRSHAVRSMTNGAAKTGVDVVAMVIPARVFYDLIGQVVALGAQGVRPVHAQVGILKQI